MAPAVSPLSLPSEANEANTCPPVSISRETSAMYPLRPPDPAPFGGTARRGSPPNIIIEPGAAATVDVIGNLRIVVGGGP